MTKNIVLCFDGTGAEVRATRNSNVALLYSALDHSQPDLQTAYYDPGVGTEEAAGAWTPPARAFSKLLGLAFGVGLRHNLGEAYVWLADHWQPGDKIFLFGFSRGAYTARALTGMLRSVGLFRPGSENLLSYLVAGYTRNVGKRSDQSGRERRDESWEHLDRLAAVFAQPVDEEGRTTPPIAYMGLWDTVKYVGLLRWQVHWRWTNQVPQAEFVRHAIAIHEWRRPFQYSPVTPHGAKPVLEEVWFSGVHSDIGGGFERDDLSRISLKWVLDGALDAGIRLRQKAYPAVCEVSVSDACSDVNKMSRWWTALGVSRRALPDKAVIHQSVQVRADGGATDLPDLSGFSRADAEWLTPRALHVTES